MTTRHEGAHFQACKRAHKTAHAGMPQACPAICIISCLVYIHSTIIACVPSSGPVQCPVPPCTYLLQLRVPGAACMPCKRWWLRDACSGFLTSGTSHRQAAPAHIFHAYQFHSQLHSQVTYMLRARASLAAYTRARMHGKRTCQYAVHTCTAVAHNISMQVAPLPVNDNNIRPMHAPFHNATCEFWCDTGMTCVHPQHYCHAVERVCVCLRMTRAAGESNQRRDGPRRPWPRTPQ